MEDSLFAIMTFIILMPLLFFATIVYHNDFEVLKKVLRLDFKNINKIELWTSFFVSLLIAAIISYSVI